MPHKPSKPQDNGSKIEKIAGPSLWKMTSVWLTRCWAATKSHTMVISPKPFISMSTTTQRASPRLGWQLCGSCARPDLSIANCAICLRLCSIPNLTRTLAGSAASRLSTEKIALAAERAPERWWRMKFISSITRKACQLKMPGPKLLKNTNHDSEHESGRVDMSAESAKKYWERLKHLVEWSEEWRKEFEHLQSLRQKTREQEQEANNLRARIKELEEINKSSKQKGRPSQ